MTVCDEDLPAGVCANATAILNNTLDELISSTSISSGVSAIIVAPDGSYTVQYENGTPITSGTVASDGSVIIEIPNPEPCADATVENSNDTFTESVPSGDTLVLEDYEFEFQDSLGNVLDTEIRPAMIAETFLFENYCPTQFSYGVFVNGVSYGTVLVDINEDINITT
jgi:hypothetical protein